MPQPRLYTGKDPITRPNAMLAAERLERETHALIDRCPASEVERNRAHDELMRCFRQLRQLWETR